MRKEIIGNYETVSIVVPVYNVEECLERCIQSIVKQTYEYLEIILVDDGSTDRSGAMCEEWANIDKRVVVIHQENAGLSAARNAGIEVAEGDYITFVDSDDYISVKYVERLLDCMQENDADISMCDILSFSGATVKANANDIHSYKMYTGIEAIELMCYQKRPFVSACGKLYKTELFDGIRYPVGRLYEDLGTTYKLFYKVNRVVQTSERLYYYFQRLGSIMNSNFSLKKWDRILFAEEIMHFVNENTPHIIKAAEHRFFLANIQVLREIPYKEERFSGEIAEIKLNIRKYRKSVMVNRKAKLVNRLIAFFSFLPIGFLQKMGYLYKKCEKATVV